MHLPTMKNTNKIIAILGLAVILIVLGFYYQKYIQGKVINLDKHFIVYSIITVILATVSTILLLANRLLFIAQQDRLFKAQQYHIEQLQEMNKIIKTQRHDFVNHLQTVYGLMQLGENAEAQAFISELYTEVQVSGEVLKLAIPELSALLLVKTGMAASLGISFTIEVRTNLSRLTIRPLDLVAIMGNLINNAMEAVENLTIPERKIRLKIFENSRFFILQIHNSGYIAPDLRSILFIPGVSTKDNSKNSGLGLASVKHITESYYGFVVVSSNPDQGTRFTVGFPKHTV